MSDKKEKVDESIDVEKSAEEKVVDDHRSMLLLSGNLSDFQLNNLKKWPFVVFGKDLDSVEIKYDFKLDKANENTMQTMKAGSVEFDFKFKKKQKKEYMERATLIMEMWCKFMFWKDTEVIFKVKGKKWPA